MVIKAQSKKGNLCSALNVGEGGDGKEEEWGSRWGENVSKDVKEG
jgi:hypothetical protein